MASDAQCPPLIPVDVQWEKKNHGNIVCVTQHVSRQTTSIQARVSNVLAGEEGCGQAGAGGCHSTETLSLARNAGRGKHCRSGPAEDMGLIPCVSVHMCTHNKHIHTLLEEGSQGEFKIQ